MLTSDANHHDEGVDALHFFTWFYCGGALENSTLETLLTVLKRLLSAEEVSLEKALNLASEVRNAVHPIANIVIKESTYMLIANLLREFSYIDRHSLELISDRSPILYTQSCEQLANIYYTIAKSVTDLEKALLYSLKAYIHRKEKPLFELVLPIANTYWSTEEETIGHANDIDLSFESEQKLLTIMLESAPIGATFPIVAWVKSQRLIHDQQKKIEELKGSKASIVECSVSMFDLLKSQDINEEEPSLLPECAGD